MTQVRLRGVAGGESERKAALGILDRDAQDPTGRADPRRIPHVPPKSSGPLPQADRVGWPDLPGVDDLGQHHPSVEPARGGTAPSPVRATARTGPPQPCERSREVEAGALKLSRFFEQAPINLVAANHIRRHHKFLHLALLHR